MRKILIAFLIGIFLFLGINNQNVFAQTTFNVGDTCGDAAFGAKTCGFNLVCDTQTNKCVNNNTSCGKVAGATCCPGTIAGSQTCNDPNLACVNNVCQKSTLTPVQQLTQSNNISANGNCGDSFISTAIGCIPFGDQNALIGFFLRWGIGIGGGIAFILILIAGFQIMTSRGDPNRLKAGQELMTSAISGLLLLIFSVVILRIIGVDILKITALGQ